MITVYMVRLGEQSVSLKIKHTADEVEVIKNEYMAMFSGLIQVDAIGWFLWQIGLKKLATKFEIK